jgi:DNA-binding CsgD family transcriptional regulator
MKILTQNQEKKSSLWGFQLKCKDISSIKYAEIHITGGYPIEERNAIESQLREYGDKLIASARPKWSNKMSSAECPNAVWIYRTPHQFRAFVCSFIMTGTKATPDKLEIIAQEIPSMDRWSMVDVRLSPYHVLTAREKTVCSLLMEGKTNREIGAQLFISPHTVDNHRVNIFRKLGLHSIRDLIHLAYSVGWPI